jgi:hypothetical protein
MERSWETEMEKREDIIPENVSLRTSYNPGN